MIRFGCPKCQQVLQIDGRYAGQVVACPTCKTAIRAPAAAPPPADPVREDRPIDLTSSAVRQPPPAETAGPAPADPPLWVEAAEEDQGGPPSANLIAGAEGLPDLGRLVGNHWPLPGVDINESITAGFLILVAGVMFLVGAWLAAQGLGPNLFWGTVFCLFAALVGATGVTMLIGVARRKNLRVLAFEDGFVYFARTDRLVFHWDEIREVYQEITNYYRYGFHVGTSHVYTVRRQDNVSVTLTYPLLDVDKLGTRVQSEVTRRLLPRALQAYRAGEVVDFGRIKVSRDGFWDGEFCTSWDELEKPYVREGYLHVYPDKVGYWGGLRMKVSKIPNLPTLLELIHREFGLS